MGSTTFNAGGSKKRPLPVKSSSRYLRAPWAWACSGAVAGALVATLVFAPASWLAAAIGLASREHLLFQAPEGTVWNGSAQVELGTDLQSDARAVLPGRLHWNIGMEGASLRIRLEAACCTSQPWTWRISPQWNGLLAHLEDQTTQWPATLLVGLGTPWNTVQPEGELSVATRGLTLSWRDGTTRLDGQAQLDALDVSSSLSTLKPMGSYRLLLDGGDVPSFQLQTLRGGLQAEGTGQWIGGRLHFEGKARAITDRSEALDNMLNMMGHRAGDHFDLNMG